jgi:hypothetical protein
LASRKQGIGELLGASRCLERKDRRERNVANLVYRMELIDFNSWRCVIDLASMDKSVKINQLTLEK